MKPISYKKKKEQFINKYGILEWIKLTGHEVEFKEGPSLEYVIAFLEKLHKKGLNSYFTNFNGTILFSREIDIEKIYNQICGMTKTEYEEQNMNKHRLKLKK